MGSARGLHARVRGASHGRRQRAVRGGPAGIRGRAEACRCRWRTRIRRWRGSLSWRRGKPREPVHLSRPRKSVKSLAPPFRLAGAFQTDRTRRESSRPSQAFAEHARGQRGVTRTRRNVRVDITVPRLPTRVGSWRPGVVCPLLGASRVLGLFSRLLARPMPFSRRRSNEPFARRRKSKQPRNCVPMPQPFPLSSFTREDLAFAPLDSRAPRATSLRSARFPPVPRPSPPAADPPR